MATVTGLTAARMAAIEAASVVGGSVDGSFHLILTKHDASTIDAGNVRGATGAAGAPGSNGAPGAAGADATSLVLANTQTSNYVLVLADLGKAVEQNSGSATSVTIPPNSSVAFPIGATIEICRYGAGSLTIIPGSGVTIPNRIDVGGTGSRIIANQLSSVSIRKRATNEWILVGDIL